MALAETMPAEEAVTHYADHPAAAKFVQQMVNEHGFEAGYVKTLLRQAERQQSILDAISRPAEKTLTWARYRKIFMTETRVEQGQAFMREYADTLARAEREFGVPAEVISAIIGVETSYGRNKGRHRVLDALTTLGFDYPPRAKFFSKQLAEYLLLVREQGFQAADLKGSYAGAMGYGQFIPSSYRHYAIDFDGDGVADIVNNPIDAIGSVANYFKAHDWRAGQAVVVSAQVTDSHNVAAANGKLKPKHTLAELKQQGYLPVSAEINLNPAAKATAMRLEGEQGQEYWIGLHNFYVITRYNHSKLYAMAVHQLSQALRQEG